MKNLYTGLLLFFLALSTTAQVGIGTTTPNATLEIKSSSQIAPANNDGILIPKIDAFPVTNPTASQDGMMVFLTASVGSNQPGFYYWNNTTSSWKGVGTHSGWATTGNSGTNPTTNFIGTTDNNDVIFKRNNVQAGLLNSDSGNTSWGVNALPLATGGILNTAIGANALFSNISGSYNTAIGKNALYSNTTGLYNTAIGLNALYQNTTGANNNAFGYNALLFNTTGSYNTAYGNEALNTNTTGYYNTANGISALVFNATGSYNTANGYEALYSNNIGEGNVANGSKSLYFNTTGLNNTALGYSSLQSNSSGNENTSVGAYANVSNGNLTNVTVIGAQSYVSTSNSMVLGSINGINGATSDVNVGIGTTSPLNKLHVVGNIRMVDGNQSAGKVLTSDANGVGTWQNLANTSYWSRSGLGQIYPTTLTDNIGIGTNSPNAPLQFSNATVNRKIVLYDTNNNDNQYYGFGVNSGVFRYQTDATVADHAFFAGVNATTSNELMRIKGTGNVGIGTNNPTTKLEVNGFTKLGSNAPAIKVLKLTGTTANAQNGSVTILHGISPDKILSTTVLVEYSTNAYVPSSYGRAGFEFDFYISNNNIYIWNSAANSSSILSKPFKIMITYEE